jgi:hypothetical protein
MSLEPVEHDELTARIKGRNELIGQEHRCLRRESAGEQDEARSPPGRELAEHVVAPPMEQDEAREPSPCAGEGGERK